MSCNISKGKNALVCKNAISGFKAIYLANYDEYNFVTSSTDSGNILTDLGDLTEVFKYSLKNTGNSFSQAITSNRDTGTTTFSPVLTFILTKLDKEMEYQVKMMAWGRPQVFVELSSGQIFLMGTEEGNEVAGTAQVGGAKDSLNGYTLTATGVEKDPIFYLNDVSVTALKALASASNIPG